MLVYLTESNKEELKTLLFYKLTTNDSTLDNIDDGCLLVALGGHLFG